MQASMITATSGTSWQVFAALAGFVSWAMVTALAVSLKRRPPSMNERGWLVFVRGLLWIVGCAIAFSATLVLFDQGGVNWLTILAAAAIAASWMVIFYLGHKRGRWPWSSWSGYFEPGRE